MLLSEVGAIVLHIYLDPKPTTLYDLDLVLDSISEALDTVPYVAEKNLVRAETFKAEWHPIDGTTVPRLQ